MKKLWFNNEKRGLIKYGFSKRTKLFTVGVESSGSSFLHDVNKMLQNAKATTNTELFNVFIFLSLF
jgi:hypothetical protein